MGRKLRRLVGALKDQASMTRATLLCSPPSSSSTSPSPFHSSVAAEVAVLRATSHRHPTSPPNPRHIAALLSFGRGARPAAAALASALSSRLLSTRDPAVALKSLLSLHILLHFAPFILLDQLSSSLQPRPSGRPTRSPLLLSSFPLGPDPLSWSLSSCVRWYSRLLELLLTLPPASSAGANPADWASSLLTCHLISEIESLANFVSVASRPPDLPGNRLVAEVERMVTEDKLAAAHGILVRLGEMRERLGTVGFADSVELAFVLRRLEEIRPPPCLPAEKSKDSEKEEEEESQFWKEVKQVRAMAEEAVVRREEEARSVKRNGAASVSARFVVRTGDMVRFQSNRWVN